MSTHPGTRASALIVHAYPEPSSFTTAQAHAARESLPAILKGWLDRVFVMGAVSGGDLGLFDGAALAGRRAVVLATTGGSADSFTRSGAFGDINDFLFHIHRGTLEFVGYDALEPVITYRSSPLGRRPARRSAPRCAPRFQHPRRPPRGSDLAIPRSAATQWHLTPTGPRTEHPARLPRNRAGLASREPHQEGTTSK